MSRLFFFLLSGSCQTVLHPFQAITPRCLLWRAEKVKAIFIIINNILIPAYLQADWGLGS